MLFKEKHPSLNSALTKTCGIIMRMSDVELADVELALADTAYDLVTLTAQAQLLTDDDIYILSEGEESEVEALVIEKQVVELHAFLNEVFDGQFYELFND